MGANSRGTTYIIVGSVLTALATVAVVLRLLARWKKGAGIAADDYMICVSVVIAYSMLAEGVIWARDGGLGKPFLSLSEREQTIFWKCFLANQYSYTFLVPSIKFSILLLYKRLFPTRPFRIALMIVGSIVIAWCLAVFFLSTFQCRPIAFFWDKSIPGGECIDGQTSFLANSISNLLTDVIILILPMPIIWRLQMSTGKKAAITGIFLLGSFVCVACILRTVSLGDIATIDISYSLVYPAMWTEVEPCVGIICACLPTMRPLLTSLFPSLMSSYAHDRTGQSGQPGRSGGNGTGASASNPGRNPGRIQISKSYKVLSVDRSQNLDSESQLDCSDEYPLSPISRRKQ